MGDRMAKYDTPLTKEEMKEFKAWTEKEKVRWEADSKERGISATWDLEDQKRSYDVQGFWKAWHNAKTEEERNILLDPETGHSTDKFKKPTHPTFSDESIHHGVDGKKGGTWGKEGDTHVFSPTKHNINNMGGYQKYIDWVKRNEPEVKLEAPSVFLNQATGSTNISDTYNIGESINKLRKKRLNEPTTYK